MKNWNIKTVIKVYVKEKFPNAQLGDLESYITSLISPKDSNSLLGGIIEDTLYKFNKNRLNELLQHAQFSFLLLEYFKDERAVRAIFRKAKNEKQISFYTDMISDMKKKC